MPKYVEFAKNLPSKVNTYVSEVIYLSDIALNLIRKTFNRDVEPKINIYEVINLRVKDEILISDRPMYSECNETGNSYRIKISFSNSEGYLIFGYAQSRFLFSMADEMENQ